MSTQNICKFISDISDDRIYTKNFVYEKSEKDITCCGVCEYIDLAVKKSLHQSASLTAPSSEGAKE